MPTFAPLLFRLEDNGAREAEHFVSGLPLLVCVVEKYIFFWIFLMAKERTGSLMMPPTISAPNHSGKKKRNDLFGERLCL